MIEATVTATPGSVGFGKTTLRSRDGCVTDYGRAFKWLVRTFCNLWLVPDKPLIRLLLFRNFYALGNLTYFLYRDKTAIFTRLSF